MAIGVRTSLTAAEAKAVKDRQDIWQDQKWMVQPKEANEVRIKGNYNVIRRDAPIITSDLDFVASVRTNGRLVIDTNPYLPKDETDIDLLLAKREEELVNDQGETPEEWDDENLDDMEGENREEGNIKVPASQAPTPPNRIPQPSNQNGPVRPVVARKQAKPKKPKPKK